MKYIVILGDGMADLPLPELGGKTPLEAAHTPNMDFLAKNGTMGLLKTVPDGMHPASDIANLSVMDYDPRRYYTGRSPLEAVSMGINLGESDVALRCNLVTLSLAGLAKKNRDFSMLLLPDHPTPISLGTHTAEPVPFALYRSDESKQGTFGYSEVNAEKTRIFIPEGFQMMAQFLAR